jgi:hypothetical protein
MASPDSEENEVNIFELLQKADPNELPERQQAINERNYRSFQLSQQRLAELIDQNSTRPTTVSSVTVLGAPNTRHSFLKRVVDPLLTANRDRPYTQSELVHEVSKTADKLKKFGMIYSIHAWLLLLIVLQEFIMNLSRSTWTSPPKPILRRHPQMWTCIIRSKSEAEYSQRPGQI